jgi:hypothetical protein
LDNLNPAIHEILSQWRKNVNATAQEKLVRQVDSSPVAKVSVETNADLTAIAEVERQRLLLEKHPHRPRTFYERALEKCHLSN